MVHRLGSDCDFSDGNDPILPYSDDLYRYVLSASSMSPSDATTLLGRVKRFLRYVRSESGDTEAHAIHAFALRSDAKVRLQIKSTIHLFHTYFR